MGDAFVALDRNGNGSIDDGSELFGTATRLITGRLAANGYEALAEFDEPANGGNGDSLLSAVDAVWPDLVLWFDTNHDAVTQLGELVPVGGSDLISLDVRYEESRRRDTHGNEFRYRAKGTVQGRKAAERKITTYDVFFVLVD